MKKRILAMILCLCLFSALLFLGSPAPVYAAGNGKAIQSGTAALETDVNTPTAATVYYGMYSSAPISWRVIGYNGAGAATSSGALTLLAKDKLEDSQFHDSSNHSVAVS